VHLGKDASATVTPLVRRRKKHGFKKEGSPKFSDLEVRMPLSSRGEKRKGRDQREGEQPLSSSGREGKPELN